MAPVAAGEQRRERRRGQHQIPVLRGEAQDQRERVVVVGEEDLVGREALLRVAEVDRVGQVRGHHQQGVDRHVVAVEQRAPPPARADVRGQGQEREQDEGSVGVDHRGGVEEQRAAQQLRSLRPREVEQPRVVEPEDEAAEHQHRIDQGDAPHEQSDGGV